MALAQEKPGTLPFAEDIRLVIWDLDETFWDGTLTEGGISYRFDHHQLVIDLANRGILSTICSKNDHSVVENELRNRGLWDHFIFPSIDWTPKGPRITAMLAQLGLRASSVLFIDDNPMNLAQASHFNLGLNVRLPSVIAGLLDEPQVLGKPDPDMERLKQYKVKERKAQVEQLVGVDAIAFLRQSNVQVCIDYNVEAHLDRAVELINRTNQLNFTKSRLPEDMTTAKQELSALLARNTTDAALIKVRDDFGDYGYVGFYLTERMHNVRRLKHFCFSCRTLNMYIEHWVYAHLDRPPLQIEGEVLTDPTCDQIDVNWITSSLIDTQIAEGASPDCHFDRIIARGGCDLASLMHYFSYHADQKIEEFNLPKCGQIFRRDHTSFLMAAIEGGLTDAQRDAARSIGYQEEDFKTELFDPVKDKTLILLSFWADADIPEYRHRQSKLRTPYWLTGAQNHDLIAKHELRAAVATTDLQRNRLKTLCSDFDHFGLLDQSEMQRRYEKIFSKLPQDTPCVVLLANERGPLHYHAPSRPGHPHHKRLNEALCLVAQKYSSVILVDPADHIRGANDMIDLNHFKRPVYHRIYQDILTRLRDLPVGKQKDKKHG